MMVRIVSEAFPPLRRRKIKLQRAYKYKGRWCVKDRAGNRFRLIRGGKVEGHDEYLVTWERCSYVAR